MPKCSLSADAEVLEVRTVCALRNVMAGEARTFG